MATLAEIPTKELCARYSDADNAIAVVKALAEATQAQVLDELAVRNPAASCAFLRAVARGEGPRMKDYFKE